MMATENSECSKKFNNIVTQKENEEMFAVGDDCAEYGLPLREVYKLAYNFYKGKRHSEWHILVNKFMLFRKGRESRPLQL